MKRLYLIYMSLLVDGWKVAFVELEWIKKVCMVWKQVWNNSYGWRFLCICTTFLLNMYVIRGEKNNFLNFQCISRDCCNCSFICVVECPIQFRISDLECFCPEVAWASPNFTRFVHEWSTRDVAVTWNVRKAVWWFR